MRLEKGYRVWGSDVTPDDNPYEAGLDFCVRIDKEGGFVGREALVEARDKGNDRELACITLSDIGAVVLGNEPVRVAGDVVGRVTSGGVGYSVSRSIAYAYLPVELAELGTAVEIYVFGEWIAGRVVDTPLFDPTAMRIRTNA